MIFLRPYPTQNLAVAVAAGEVEEVGYECSSSAAGYSENSGVDTGDNVSYYDSREEDEEEGSEESDCDNDEDDDEDEMEEDDSEKDEEDGYYDRSYVSIDEPDSFYQRKGSKASFNDNSNRSVRSINGSLESGSDFSGALEINPGGGGGQRNVSISNLNTLKEEASPRTPGSASSATTHHNQQLMQKNLFETPKTVPNKFSFGNMWKRVESSVDYNKIKSVVEGTYSELKEVVLSNAPISPLNQQEITSKLKSLSNYQINAGQYLNGLVKSNSTYSPTTSYGEANSRKTAETQTVSYAQNNRHRSNTESSDLAGLDLNPLPDDETYKPINIKWWQFEQDGDAKNKKKSSLHENTLVDVQISSCNM
jgi:hypothetical protein